MFREMPRIHSPKTLDPLMLAALAIVTIGATGLLLPAPINAGSVLAWSQVPLPLVLAGGMAHLALQARRRGEHSTANAVLIWAVTAVAFIAFVAVRLGG